MSKIIAFGSHKGGVGKSTLLFSILTFLLMRGEKVCVVECDKQHSIKDACERRNEDRNLTAVDYYECYSDIIKMAKSLSKKYDFVLIDAPGNQSAEFMKSIACADVYLTFVEPGAEIETNTLGEFVHDIKTAQASINKNLKAWIVLNKCDTNPNDSEASELRQLLSNDPDWLPVPRQRIYARKAHKKAYNAGMGVHEFNDKNGNKSRGEIELLLKEISVYN